MKKTVYILVAIMMLFAISLVGCSSTPSTPAVEEHVCHHVCEICGKCTDASCTNAVCADKCPGHVEEHVCHHVCEICGKCTDDSCTDDVCKDKCPGHFVITYDVNGGNALESDTQVVDAGSAYTLITPSRDGFKFIKWVDSETNVEVTEGAYNFGKNITIKAVWVQNNDGWSEWVGSSGIIR